MGKSAVCREVRIDLKGAGLASIDLSTVRGAVGRREGDALLLTVELPPMAPGRVEIGW